jgi:hypothetical protein
MSGHISFGGSKKKKASKKRGRSASSHKQLWDLFAQRSQQSWGQFEPVAGRTRSKSKKALTKRKKSRSRH